MKFLLSSWKRMGIPSRQRVLNTFLGRKCEVTKKKPKQKRALKNLWVATLQQSRPSDFGSISLVGKSVKKKQTQIFSHCLLGRCLYSAWVLSTAEQGMVNWTQWSKSLSSLLRKSHLEKSLKASLHLSGYRKRTPTDDEWSKGQQGHDLRRVKNQVQKSKGHVRRHKKSRNVKLGFWTWLTHQLCLASSGSSSSWLLQLCCPALH